MAEYMASMPIMNLTPGMVVRFEAISPTDGSQVSGVIVSNATLYANDAVGAGDGAGQSGPFMLVPGPTPVGNPGDGATVRGGL